MIKRRFEIGEHPIGCGAAPAHGFGIFAVELGKVCFGAGARAPAPRSLRNSTMPVDELPRRQLHHQHAGELRQNVPERDAFDTIGRLAAAAAVVFEIVSHSPGDGVRPRAGRAESGCEPSLMRPPRPRRPLRLGEVQDTVAVCILQVIGKTELDLAIDTAVGAPPRDPRTARGASAIADMEALLDHAPIGFGAERQA